MEQIVPWDTTPAALNRGCDGKDRYPSASAASVALKLFKSGRIRHAKSDGRWDCLGVYECQFCGSFHLGH